MPEISSPSPEPRAPSPEPRAPSPEPRGDNHPGGSNADVPPAVLRGPGGRWCARRARSRPTQPGSWRRRSRHRRTPAHTSAISIPSCRGRRIARHSSSHSSATSSRICATGSARPGRGSSITCSMRRRKVDPKPELIRRTDRGDYVEEYLTFQTTPDLRIPAYVLLPKQARTAAPASSSSTATTASISGARRRSWPSIRSIPR